MGSSRKISLVMSTDDPPACIYPGMRAALHALQEGTKKCADGVCERLHALCGGHVRKMGLCVHPCTPLVRATTRCLNEVRTQVCDVSVKDSRCVHILAHPPQAHPEMCNKCTHTRVCAHLFTLKHKHYSGVCAHLKIHKQRSEEQLHLNHPKNRERLHHKNSSIVCSSCEQALFAREPLISLLAMRKGARCES